VSSYDFESHSVSYMKQKKVMKRLLEAEIYFTNIWSNSKSCTPHPEAVILLLSRNGEVTLNNISVDLPLSDFESISRLNCRRHGNETVTI